MRTTCKHCGRNLPSGRTEFCDLMCEKLYVPKKKKPRMCPGGGKQAVSRSKRRRKNTFYDKLVKFVKDNPGCQVPEVSKYMGASAKRVQKELLDLSRAGKIKREWDYSDRQRYYVIDEDIDEFMDGGRPKQTLEEVLRGSVCEF